MKQFLKDYWMIVILALLGVAVAFSGIMAIFTTPSHEQLLDTMKQQIESRHTQEMQKLTDKIQTLEKEIKLSNQKYSQLKTSIQTKDKEIESIKKPTSNTELRQRLADLGYQAR